MLTWTTATDSPEETRLLGQLLGKYAQAGMVILLNGELGAGKTCFAQGVAKGLGVSSDTPVVSPSYGLMNIYPGRLPLYHFDLYRLTRIDDLDDLGFGEFAEGAGLTLVEWADRVSGHLEASIAITIGRTGDLSRRFAFAMLNGVGAEVVRQVEQEWSGPDVGEPSRTTVKTFDDQSKS